MFGFIPLFKGIIYEIKLMLFQNYSRWIRQSENSHINRHDTELPYMPKITIVTAVFNPPLNILRDTMESVLSQTYANWEFCIADGKSNEGIRGLLEEYARKDQRIKIVFLDENKGIAGNFNEGIRPATGEYISFLDHDDMLSPNALFEIAKRINEEKEIDILYSDEDLVDASGVRTNPEFKADWSPDLLRSYNYMTHFFVIRKILLDEIGGYREGFDGAQDYDLILRAAEKTKNIAHIPKILYHWRHSPGSVLADADNKPQANENGRRAVEEHLERMQLKGRITYARNLYSYRAIYEIEGVPKVSIIIPNTDHRKELARCIASVLSKSTYRNYEILIAENNSSGKEIFDYYKELSGNEKIRILTWKKPFNYSAINNFCVQHASGEFLLFLNNDTQVISPDWIEQMLMHCRRKDVGAVGAKLYYPDDTIQHAGVIILKGGMPVHAFRHFHRRQAGYMARLNLIQNYSAVTAACMMCRKSVFEEAGEFAEEFAFAYNDTDFCFKIRDKGYLVVWTPYAELYHYESKTRGYDTTRRKKEIFNKEYALFKERGRKAIEKGDPYYNPNLTQKRPDFSLSIK